MSEWESSGAAGARSKAADGGRRGAEPSRGCVGSVRHWLTQGDNLLLVATLCGVCLGVVLGVVLKETVDPKGTAVLLIAFPGTLLMNLLKMIILPMVICSIVASLVQLSPGTSGRLGLLTLAWYICSTVLAVTCALVLLMALQPGHWASSESDTADSAAPVDAGGDDGQKKQTLDMVLDFFRRLIPDNIFGALLEQAETVRANATAEPEVTFVGEPNILGVVVFSIVFGLSAGALGRQSRPVAEFFISLDAIIVKLVSTVMWALPLGVISLVAGSILEVESDPLKMLSSIGIFVATAFVALTLHFYVTLPLAFFLLTRRNPYAFLWNQLAAYANVMGHSSSTAALPVTTHCLVEKNGVDARVASFCLPVGAAVNIDGAALYEALAAVFVAQMHYMRLGWIKSLAVIVTVTLSSVGSSGLPGAGLVSVLPVLAPIEILASDVAMLIVTDWLVDRYRTCNNVMADSLAAGVVNHLCRGQLSKRSHALDKDPPVIMRLEENGPNSNVTLVAVSEGNADVVDTANRSVHIDERQLDTERGNRVAPVSRF